MRILFGTMIVFVAGCGGPQGPEKDVEFIEIRFEPWGPDNKAPAQPIRSNDKHAIRQLLAAIQVGEETSEHKCAHRMVLLFAKRSGERLELRTLPGHDDGFYEYRSQGKIYRVERERFVAAIAQLGVDPKLIPRDPFR